MNKRSYNNYLELMTQKVIPLKNEKSSWIRLDGQISGGNREIFACFQYNGGKWKIHSDTHIDQLFKAYNDILKGNNPFVFKTTDKNKTCLVLRDEIASKPKHIYIYLMNN